MTWAQVVREMKANPLVAWYFVQGHVRWWLHRKAILRYLIKAHQCEACYKAGFCTHCGCPVGPLFLSSKKCENDLGQNRS